MRKREKEVIDSIWVALNPRTKKNSQFYKFQRKQKQKLMRYRQIFWLIDNVRVRYPIGDLTKEKETTNPSVYVWLSQQKANVEHVSINSDLK